VGAPLWLPPQRPRILAVEIRDRSGRLAALHRSVTRALADASGWEPERRRFRPHMTLARMRQGTFGGHGAVQEPPLLAATPALAFTPDAVVLYRSLPAPGGSTYEPLATCALGPDAP
jgi:2'-5' RNA ligase